MAIVMFVLNLRDLKILLFVMQDTKCDPMSRHLRHRVQAQPGTRVRGELLESLQDHLQGGRLQLHTPDLHEAAGEEM